MSRQTSRKAQRPRELRRRVLVSARVRQPSGWSEASILNISSRGLLIHSARPLPQGSWVELHRGDHVINARVVWRDGSKAGLQADDRLPVEAIASGEISGSLRFAPAEPQPRRRSADKWRVAGRRFEFASVLGVGAALVAATVTMVEQAFAHPLALVAAVLR
jgi:hypothetical protein